MTLLLLGFGGAGFLLAGNALTKFKDTKEAQWATVGVIEILIGSYFLAAAVGSAVEFVT